MLYIEVVVYIFIDQEELFEEHISVEVGHQKGRGSNNEPKET